MNSLVWRPGPPKLNKLVGCRISKNDYIALGHLVEKIGQTKSEFLRSLLVAALAANTTSVDQAISSKESTVTEP